MVAGTATAPEIRALFEGLLPAEVIAAYDQLLSSDGCPKDQAEATVGGAGLVAELTRWGMAHVQPHTPADPAWFRPAPPRSRLAGRPGRPSEPARPGPGTPPRRTSPPGRAQARFGVAATGRFPEHLVSAVAENVEISELSAALMNTARQDWMTLENASTEMPVTEDFARPPLPAFEGRVRCRSIYDAAMMDDPAARQVIQACVDAGEQARLLPRVPMKLKLADQVTALLPLTPSGTAGALLIKAPVILAALREYFELLWDRATPLSAPRAEPGAVRPTPAQQRVLERMAEGLGDDAIARRAGVSTTTVRRHITALSARLGVSSRFALGPAAQRRGWIG